jgi:hypothetical protein
MGAVRTTYAMVAALVVRRRQLEVLAFVGVDGVNGGGEGTGTVCVFLIPIQLYFERGWF